MKPFDEVWDYLQRYLKAGTKVRNWTTFRGYLGDSMTIEQVKQDVIDISAPGAKNIQVVPKEDFERVWCSLSDYKSQKVRRYELRDMTRYSKYIISILHWYEKVVGNEH